MALLVGIGANVVALLAAAAFAHFGLGHQSHEALFAICIAPLVAMSLFFGSIIQSMQRTAAATLPHEVMRPALYLLGCRVLLYLFDGLDEYQAIGILFAAMRLVVSAQFCMVIRGLPFKWAGTPFVNRREEWHEVSIPLLFSALANSILIRIDVLALEIMHTDEKAVGVFTRLLFMASLLWMNFSAINNVIFPRIAALEGDKAGLQKLFNDTIKIALVINLCVAGLIAAFADKVLAWFHGDLLDYKNWLYVVLAGAVLNCANEIAAPFVRLGGLQREAARLATLCLIGTIVVTPTAIALFGMPGAIVTLIGMRFVRGMGYVYFLRTRAGIAPFR